MAAGKVEARCTGCDRVFEVTMQETTQPDGGAKIEFFCTHCDKNYEVAYLSKRALSLRDQYHRSLERNGRKARKTQRLLERYRRSYVGLSAENT